MQLHLMLTAGLTELQRFQPSKQFVSVYAASAKTSATYTYICSTAQKAQIAA